MVNRKIAARSAVRRAKRALGDALAAAAAAAAAAAGRVRIGALVELVGDRHTASDVAAVWKTIDYDVTCSIGRRVARFFSVGE